MSHNTVLRRKKKFDSGLQSIQNASKSRRPKSASCDKIVTKITELLKETLSIQCVIVHEWFASHYQEFITF